MSQTTSQLKLIIPDILLAMKDLLTASEDQFNSRSQALDFLMYRIKCSYPPNIAKAACTIAGVRFERYFHDLERSLEIKETMSEWEDR